MGKRQRHIDMVAALLVIADNAGEGGVRDEALVHMWLSYRQLTRTALQGKLPPLAPPATPVWMRPDEWGSDTPITP